MTRSKEENDESVNMHEPIVGVGVGAAGGAGSLSASVAGMLMALVVCSRWMTQS